MTRQACQQVGQEMGKSLKVKACMSKSGLHSNISKMLPGQQDEKHLLPYNMLLQVDDKVNPASRHHHDATFLHPIRLVGTQMFQPEILRIHCDEDMLSGVIMLLFLCPAAHKLQAKILYFFCHNRRYRTFLLYIR